MPPPSRIRKHLTRHIRNYFCGDDDGDTCLPVLDDTVFEEEETVPPPDIDSDQDIVDPPPPPVGPFPGWDSFDPAMTPSIRDHFITGPGKLLSEQSRIYFANEHSDPGNGVANLVANAFNYKGSQLPSPLEIYFHLYVTAFLMTLTAKQTDVFSNIMGVSVSNGIEIGENGVCKMFSSKVTRLPSCMKDILDIYTSNKNSIYKCIPSPLAQSSNTGTFAYSSYADCIQHFLGWGPDTFNFLTMLVNLELPFLHALHNCSNPARLHLQTSGRLFYYLTSGGISLKELPPKKTGRMYLPTQSPLWAHLGRLALILITTHIQFVLGMVVIVLLLLKKFFPRN
jgi:hypothetical protein